MRIVANRGYGIIMYKPRLSTRRGIRKCSSQKSLYVENGMLNSKIIAVRDEA
jgi:hypothetical protein